MVVRDASSNSRHIDTLRDEHTSVVPRGPDTPVLAIERVVTTFALAADLVALRQNSIAVLLIGQLFKAPRRRIATVDDTRKSSEPASSQTKSFANNSAVCLSSRIAFNITVDRPPSSSRMARHRAATDVTPVGCVV